MCKVVASTMVLAFLVAGLGSSALAESSIEQVLKNVQLRTARTISGIPSVSVQELRTALGVNGHDFKLIDVRSREEFDAGHIAGAINIPRGQAEWGVPAVARDPEQKIFVYCRSGNRSAYVVKMLLEVGYKDVVNVSGGFKGWLRAGFPYSNMHGTSVLAEGEN